ncbi:hypothetical protein AMJ86_02455 [bacterium SM23_57]|nr:MAG: hypothetical protein AMJ86_02455 [bacterium SM23_57]
MESVKCTLSMLCTVLTLIAVTTPAITETKFGVKVGASSSTLQRTSSGIDEDQKSLWYFSGGIFLRFDLNPTVKFQPELLYVRKGARWEDSEESDNYSASYKSEQKWEYLEIPMLMVITPKTNMSISPNFYLGPAPAFLLKARYDYSYNSSYSENGYTYNNSFSYSGTIGGVRNVDIGIILGGGLDIPAGDGLITTDIRYNLGLGNLYNTSSKIHHRCLSFLVGYRF